MGRPVWGGATYAMELHVQATGIAHGLTLCVAAPQRGGGGLAVGTGQAHSAGGGLQTTQETNPSNMSTRQVRLLPLHRERCGAALPIRVAGAGHDSPV